MPSRCFPGTRCRIRLTWALVNMLDRGRGDGLQAMDCHTRSSIKVQWSFECTHTLKDSEATSENNACPAGTLRQGPRVLGRPPLDPAHSLVRARNTDLSRRNASGERFCAGKRNFVGKPGDIARKDHSISRGACVGKPGVDGSRVEFVSVERLPSVIYEVFALGLEKTLLLNPAAIYANNEISLRDVEVYGFDYDYTLAQYADALHPEIFSAARDILIEHYKYPEGIRKYDYNPSFAIRGLHYDIQKSLLMKIDAFHYVQLGTAYRGLQPVPDEEVIELYGGTQHIPLYQMSGFYGKGPSIKQFMDIFSLPEMALLSCVVDYFLGHSLEFDQAHLYKDVTDAIRDVHVKGLMYQWIEQDMEKYILRGDETFAVLSRLVAHGKQLFLITNSPFSFVDKGMRHMVGPDWRQLFDVVIVQADKPSFFTDRRKKLDEKGSLQWDRITRLEKGKIYRQGNLFDFLRLTEWRGPRVLYFGDHLYSDLADLMLRHGWRTGAIIPELEREIRIINTEQYMHSLTWQQALTGLLERMQTYQDAESRQVLAAWMKERQELRCITKALFNAQFGSIFRTFHNPTYFSRRLVRFSDLYMASLSCLLNYRVDFTFYPRRTPLQHEAPLWMDQLCTGCMKTPFLGDMAHIR
ncbi:hypothetical protein EGK_16677 [Macaca mulatta]|uniref:5'-nucleotidase domain containing 2 n=1 Tax=Macaca mulatta TaxID=9544 RepID=G7MV92_MACMU|nr:hypothetical protein EGK_16677 [Macaca mulatta]